MYLKKQNNWKIIVLMNYAKRDLESGIVKECTNAMYALTLNI